jgi:SAM-dependent methyltransferase
MAQPVDPDTAIALRQVHTFPPARLSAFEDPADEKSSHASQRYSALIKFFAGREPSWYESITRDFAGMHRVLDLGAGPGLALDALRAHGVREPIGIDRWHGFLHDAEAHGRRVILHDLTLPMPFFGSASFEGVFSHFVLDYMSPIGVQQVLREARRILVPGGLLVLHLTTPGLALGDPVRTTPYDAAALTRLLEAAGFEDFETRQPDGDKEVAIVHARGPITHATEDSEEGQTYLELEPGREVQVTAGLRPADPLGDLPTVSVEVGDNSRSVGYRPRLDSVRPEDGGKPVVDLSVCVRLVAAGPGEVELQTWTWRGVQIAAMDTVRLRMRPDRLRIQLAGEPQHRDVWHPAPPMLELPGDPYITIEDASPSHRPDEPWRARGRQVIVERPGDDPGRLRTATAENLDHFLVHRPDAAAPPDIQTLEREWMEERLHGLVLELEDAVRPESLPLLLWAGLRGALIYLEPDSWDAVIPAPAELPGSLGPPLLIVDPFLSGRGDPQAEVEVPREIGSALDVLPSLHLVLAGPTAEAAADLWERYPARVLVGKSADLGHGRLVEEATENLRYLTERTTLMWLRSTSGREERELGRYSRAGLAGHFVHLCG